MIVAVLVPHGDGEDALAEHRPLLVGDQSRIAWIGNDGVDPLNEPKPAIHLPKQQRPGIGGDGSTGKIGDDLTTTETGKDDRVWITVCHVTALPPCGFGSVETTEQYGRQGRRVSAHAAPGGRDESD